MLIGRLQTVRPVPIIVGWPALREAMKSTCALMLLIQRNAVLVPSALCFTKRCMARATCRTRTLRTMQILTNAWAVRKTTRLENEKILCNTWVSDLVDCTRESSCYSTNERRFGRRLGRLRRQLPRVLQT